MILCSGALFGTVPVHFEARLRVGTARPRWQRDDGFVGAVGGAHVVGAILTAIAFPLILS
jgi:hypothetical protein